MTLLIATPVGLLLGALLGVRRRTFVAAGLVWYACLAIQTAHLAHPSVRGFLGVEALPAVQGSHYGQYWVAQPLILGLVAGAAWVGARLRRASRRPRELTAAR